MTAASDRPGLGLTQMDGSNTLTNSTKFVVNMCLGKGTSDAGCVFVLCLIINAVYKAYTRAGSVCDVCVCASAIPLIAYSSKEVPTAYGSDAPQAWPTSMLFRRHTCTKFPVWRFPAPSNRRAMIQLGLGTGLGLSRQLKVTINQAIFTRSSSERWKKHIATAGSRRNSSHFQVHTAASSPAACPPPSDRTIRFTPATPHDYVTKSRTCTRFELLASLSARDTASTKLFGTRLFLNSLPRTPASPISDSKPRSQPDEENLACCGAMDDRDHLALTIFSSFSSSGSDLFPLVATERYDETSIACHSNRRCGAKACKDGLRSCYPRSVEKGSPNLQRLSLVALPRHGMLCQRCMHTCTTVEQTL